jgi:hypothetical protein
MVPKFKGVMSALAHPAKAGKRIAFSVGDGAENHRPGPQTAQPVVRQFGQNAA